MRVTVEGERPRRKIAHHYYDGFGDANNNGRVDPTEKAPSNVQIDIRLARTLKEGVEIYGGAENLTRARVSTRSFLGPPEGELLWFVGARIKL